MILLQDVIGAASTVEILWLFSAISGVILSTLNGYEGYLDLRALDGKRNGRRRIAVGTIRREGIRALVNLLFGIVGVVAVLQPANPHSTFLGVIVSLVLLAASVAYNVNSFLDRQDRIYLMQYGMQPRDDKGRFTSDGK